MKKFKGIKILSLLAAAAIVVCCLPWSAAAAVSQAFYNDRTDVSFTAVKQSSSVFQSKKIALSNGGFNKTSVATFAAGIPDGWSNLVPDSSAMNGIVNTASFYTWINENSKDNDENRLDNVDALSENPMVMDNSDDSQVLVLAHTENYGGSKAGVKSEEIEFVNSGYYIVSIDFYAVKSESAIYLIPNTEYQGKANPRIDIEQVSYKNPETQQIADNYSKWQTASFFVKTDALRSSKFSIGLYLGKQKQSSGGVVYYDNVRIEQCSERVFNEKWDSKKAIEDYENSWRANNNVLMVDLSGRARADDSDPLSDEYKIVKEFVESDNKFAADGAPFTFDAKTAKNNTYQELAADINEFPSLLNFKPDEITNKQPAVLPHKQVKQNYDYVAPQVMLVAAWESNAMVSLNQPLIVKQHQIYMISYYALTSSESSSIRIRDTRLAKQEKAEKTGEDYKIPSYVKTFDNEYEKIMTADATSSLSYNNWVLNTIFIAGETYEDTELDLEFWIGRDGTNATGWCAIAEFNIENVSYEYYEEFMEATNCKSYNLDQLTSPDVIKNPYFNVGTARTGDNPFPLKAAEWKLTCENDDDILSGIINTSPEHWETYAYPDNYEMASNPGSKSGPNQNNNIYMMQNLHTTWQKLTSNKFWLSTGVYNLVSFNACLIENVGNPVKAFAIIETSDGREIARIEITGGYKQWRTYTFAVKDSKITSHEIQLSFMLGENRDNNPNYYSASGVMFLENIAVQTTEEYNADWKDDYELESTYADLADPTKFADPNGTSLSFIPDDEFSKAEFDRETEFLTIHSFATQTVTSVTNTLSESIKQDKFYEYTITVAINENKPERIKKYETQEKKDGSFAVIDVTDYKKDYDYGVNFRLKNLEGGILNLKKTDISDMLPAESDERFAQLKFFIRPDSDMELELIVEFGNEFMAVSGSVTIAEITLEEIQEPRFKTAKADFDKAVKDDNVLGYRNTAIITESKYIPSENENSGEKPDINWILIPSLITAAAIIFTVAAWLIRKYRFNIHIEKTHTSYADDQMGLRSAKELRAKKIKQPIKDLKKSESPDKNIE